MKFILAFLFIFQTCSPTWAQTTKKNIEFNSVNGADYFTNYVLSPSAKKNASNTTTSNATVTRDTDAADAIDGVSSYLVDASAQNGYVEFTLGTVYEPAISGNCEFKGVFKGDASLYKAQILDGSANVLNSTSVLTNETNFIGFSVIYPCAASGSRKVRITQTEAGTGAAINVGKLYYGQATGIGSGVPNNVFSAKVSSTGVVSDENEDFISGNCTTTLTSRQTCNFITSKFTTTPSCTITISDGNTTTWRIVSQSTSQIVFETLDNAGTAIAAAVNMNCIRSSTDFIQPTITANQWDFDWTTCPSISGSWVTNTTYTCKWMRKGGNAYFDMQVDVSGVPTATTLSVNLPITIDTAKMNTSPAGAPVKLGDTIVVDNGVQNYQGPVRYASTTAVLASYWNVNGTTINVGNVSSTSPFTFGNTDSVWLKFSVPVVGWTENQNAPQLVGSVTSNSSGALRTESATIQISNATTCSVISQSASWLGTCTATGGDASIAINAGTFSSAPRCSGLGQGSANAFVRYAGSMPTTTTLGITHRDTSNTLSTAQFDVTCIGAR